MQKLIRVKGMKIQNPINEPMAMEKAVLVQKFGEVVSSEFQSPKAPVMQYIANGSVCISMYLTKNFYRSPNSQTKIRQVQQRVQYSCELMQLFVFGQVIKLDKGTGS